MASKADKGSKPTKEHDAQIAAQAKKDAEKEFKQFAEKVIKISMILLILYKYITWFWLGYILKSNIFYFDRWELISTKKRNEL